METTQMTLNRLGITKVAESHGISEYRLESNGLKIVLMEDHKRPVVLVDVLYRIGSRNEGNGFTGSAHFFEHLMFKGTKDRHPKDGRGIDDLLKPVGAIYNANTWLDRTQYFELLPASQLALGLEIEFDRMRNLQVTTEDRNSEMTVVRSEFEIGKNDPEQLIDELGWAQAFTQHAYHWSTIGYLDDVENVPLERMKEFYDTFYHPNNATCIVIGDFDPQQALELIQKNAAHFPPSPKPIPDVYTREPKQSGERRFELCQAGMLPLLWIGFHIPEARHPDIYALAAAAAVLGHSGRRASRLYKRLIDTNLAAKVVAHAQENRDPSLFYISATAGRGVKIEDVEKAVLEEVERLAKEPVSEAELKRAKDANRKGTILGRADILSFLRQIGEAEAVADWQWMVGYDDKFEAVTPADIMRVAAKYLQRKNRTVGHFLPEAPAEEASETTTESAVSAAPSAPAQASETAAAVAPAQTSAPAARSPEQAAPVPSVADAVSATNASVTTAVAEKAGNAGSPAAVATGNASAPTAAIPTASQSVAAQMTKKVLANGLTVMVMPMRGTGSVSVSGKLRAGGIYSPADKTLVAALTASMLVKGSKNFSKAAVAEALESMGTDLRFAANNFTVAFGTTVVTADLQPLLEMATDLVQNPLFDAEELKRSAKLSAANLMNQMDDPGSMASNRLSQALYSKESIYHDKEYQSLIAELETISADDLRSFHTAHYSPKGAILSVVGDVDADQALALVEKCFGSWTGPEPKPIDDAALFKLGDRLSASSPQKAERISVPMVEKTSVSIVIGVPSLLKRSAPDYFAALLANAALGNDTLSARLGQIVREKHGLTYGIRSVFQDPSYGGAPWLITLDTNPANVEKALKLTAEVTKSYIEGGITDKELADEQGRAAGQFSLRLRNSAGIAQILTDYELIGIGAKAIDSFEQDVRAVTKEQVNAAIRQYLRIDEAVTVLAGTFAD